MEKGEGSFISDRAKIGENVSIGKNVTIKGEEITIGDRVKVEDNVKLVSKALRIGKGSVIKSGASLSSREVVIGEETTINGKCDIFVYDKFEIGNMCFLGTASFRGREITIGDEFYSSTTYASPLTIGGGGRNYPTAVCRIGDRCTMHNNFINISKPVVIGDDVGFSPDTIVITHGYWQSVLQGYSSAFAPVSIGSNVWLGMRVIILPGVEIGDGVTIGAGSVVTKDIPSKCVAAGVPAKVIKRYPDYPKEIDDAERNRLMKRIMKDYSELLEYKGFTIKTEESENLLSIDTSKGEIEGRIIYSFDGSIPNEKLDIPAVLSKETFRIIVLSFEDIELDKIYENSALLNLRTSKMKGEHCALTDDLRDFLRREGIRFYGRKFRSIPPAVEEELKRMKEE